MRINVTGNAGSGKTTLAKQLGLVLNVPVFSLDSVVWQPGWLKTPPEERANAERKLVAPSDWVIDGVSPFVRAHADLVIFLDVPWPICALRAVARTCRYFKGTRPELPPPCPEINVLPRLLRLIHRFPRRVAPQLREEARLAPERFRLARYPVRIETLLRELADVLPPQNLQREGRPARVLG